jgi:hypothetical protein
MSAVGIVTMCLPKLEREKGKGDFSGSNCTGWKEEKPADEDDDMKLLGGR